MRLKHLLINIALFVALLGALFAMDASIRDKNWSTIAASLAVITAVVSAWSAQRIIWKQEKELEPKIECYLDLKNRKGVTQFVVENVGGSTAYNISIMWTDALIDKEGNEVHFSSGKEGVDIMRLTKGQRISRIVHGTKDLYEYYDSKEQKLEFAGELKYYRKEKAKLSIRHEIFLTLEPYRLSLSHEDEMQEFLFQGSKIHNDLREINKSIAKISQLLENNEEPNS